MAQGVAIKNGGTFYAINLASSSSNVNETTTRVNWSCNVQFGDWYYWGLRLHVSVDGVEVGSWAGACTYRGQVVINVSGSRDISRADSGRNVTVRAWTTSEIVNGYGGVGITTSCYENRSVPAISYQTPAAPSNLSAWRNSDSQVAASWKNNPSGTSKKYTGLVVSFETDERWAEQVVSADTKSATRSTSANHRYRFAVRSKNNAGMSDWVYSGYVYTTPSAPSNCAVARKSDNQASITWSRGSNAGITWLNVLIERRVDDGGWTQIGTLGGGATNYTDNGISANHRYQYRVRSYNGLYSGYATSGYIYTTPAAPKSVGISKIGGTKVRISVQSASPYADGYLYQLSVNGGGWAAEKSMGTSVDVDAAGGTVKARVRAKRGSLYSAYRESGSVTTIVAPSAPTVGEFGSVYALPATVRVTWTRLHPDGTEQTAAQVEVTDPKGVVKTVDVAKENHADIELTLEGEYRVRVRTKGLDPSWGAWSPHGALHAEYAPQAFFTTPAVDGHVVEGVPFTVRWEIETSSGVSAQEIRLLSASGDALHTAALPADARSYTFSVDTYLPQTLREYTVALFMSDGYSLTAEAQRRVSTDYAEPAIPYIEIANSYIDLSSHVTVLQGEAGWTVDDEGILHSPEYWDGSTDHIPVSAGFEGATELGMFGIGTVVETVKLSVARLLDDGSQEMLAEDLPSGHEVIDRLPPLNSDYTYLITAYSAAGTATTAELGAHLDSDGREAYNFGADASKAILLQLDANGSSSTTHGGEWFQFATGPDSPALPAFYPDGKLGASGSHSYIVTTVDEYRDIDATRRGRRNAVCWFRDHWGGRHRVMATWTLGYAAGAYGVWNVSASLTEAMWEVPRNG